MKIDGHWLSTTIEPGIVTLTIRCTNDAGAPCRRKCSDGCESWGDEHSHEVVDAGFCNAVDWFEADGALDCYHGEPTALHDNPPVKVYLTERR